MCGRAPTWGMCSMVRPLFHPMLLTHVMSQVKQPKWIGLRSV